jgi:hypothetical protein
VKRESGFCVCVVEEVERQVAGLRSVWSKKTCAKAVDRRLRIGVY